MLNASIANIGPMGWKRLHLWWYEGEAKSLTGAGAAIWEQIRVRWFARFQRVRNTMPAAASANHGHLSTTTRRTKGNKG
jgi:hypothetical protein